MKKIGIMVLCWILFPIMVSAGSKSVMIHIGETDKEVLFQITWENSEQGATVEISSPDGAIYGNEKTPNNVTEGDGRILVNVGLAAEGDWQVNVTGEGLGEVQISAGEMPDNLQLDVFSVEDKGQEYHFSWRVSGSSEEDLYFHIYRDNDLVGFDGDEVKSFSEKETGEISIEKSELSDGVACFYMKVEDPRGLFQYLYADSVFLNESGTSEYVPELSVSAVNSDVYIEYESSSTVKALLYSVDTMELLHEEILVGSPVYIPFPENVTELKVAVATCDGDGKHLGAYSLYQIELDSLKGCNVVFPEGDSTNQVKIQATVEMNDGCSMTGSVNDEILLKDENEEGVYDITLSEGNNEIIFYIEDTKGNGKTFTKQLYVDTVAPTLSIIKDINKNVTDENYIYADGYSEAGATLTCNEQEVEMVQSYFSIKCPLKYGDNMITIKAQDKAGNLAEYTAVVTRKLWTIKFIQMIMLSVLALTLFIIYMIIFIKGSRRRT